VSLFAIILAAGEGRRMGGPKTRLVFDGRTLLAHQVDAFVRLGCTRVVAVVRPEEERSAPTGSLVVPALTRSPAESLACGLRALALDAADLVFIGPVDMRPPRPETLTTLRDAASAWPEVDAVTPRHRGKSGHPILVRFRIVGDHLDLRRTPPPLRNIIRSARRLRVDVEDAAILDDFDTPLDMPKSPSFQPSF